jgi:peptide/nickel transport system substrate-binding protein
MILRMRRPGGVGEVMAKRLVLIIAVAAALATLVGAGAAEARTIRWAAMGDALTLDPHATSDGGTQALNRQIYDTLATRGPKGELVGELAASWRTLSLDANTWELKLRPGVKFHNGAALTADDVVFSLQRALAPASDLKALLASLDRVVRVDDLTVRIRTKGPNPQFPNALTGVFILNRAWAEANSAAQPQDWRIAAEGFTARNANGTGPYALVSREPGVRTVLRRNEQYWSKDPAAPLEITEVIHTPIRSGAARIAALASGELDFVQDVQAQDVDRLKSLRNVTVTTGNENGTVFLGLDAASPELKSSTVKGKNPFADKRVRQALNLAINRTALQQVLRGQAVPAGALLPPAAAGWSRELDQPSAADAAKAKALLAEAGYPEGFTVTLHCPSDAIVNGEVICQEVVGMMARVGVVVNLVMLPKAQAIAALQKTPPESEFYLSAYDVPTLDSETVFAALYHTREGRYGAFNAARFSNADLDRKIEALTATTDPAKRAIAVTEIWKAVQDEAVYLPLVHPVLAYAARGFEVAVDPENRPRLKGVPLK